MKLTAKRYKRGNVGICQHRVTLAMDVARQAGARGDRRRCGVQPVTRKAGGGFVFCHEIVTLGTGDDILDILERSATAVIDHVQEAERASPPVAKNNLGDRPAQIGIKGRERRRANAMFKDFRAQNARIDDGLAGAV